jgi:Uma2 family endonuclease
MVALKDSSKSMTAAEYFLWEQTQTERHEFWRGDVVAMSGGTRNHNRISLNFSKLLDDALSNRRCEVYINDVKVQIEPGRKFFYPDGVVTFDQRENDPILVQFPYLVIEVLSPSIEACDRGIKLAQYRRCATLQKYVLVQSSTQVSEPMVEIFRRSQTVRIQVRKGIREMEEGSIKA